MATKKGVFKSCMFGCLGILVFGLLFTGVAALMAWRSVGDQDIQEADNTPAASEAFTERTGAPGRVILKLGQAEFRILKSDPGEGLRVEARYDREAYSLEDQFVRADDGTWTYALEFESTIPGMQSLFRSIMGADTKTYVYVYLPPDAPIALELYVEKGGFEAELGGLWLTEADITFHQGGFSLDIDEPMREPMERLRIKGAMGGFDARRLGNASPRTLDVTCRMGGADIGMGGEWAQDCDASLSISMGGMSVRVPEEIELEYGGEGGSGFERVEPGEREVPRPRLRLDVTQKFGEVEVRRH